MFSCGTGRGAGARDPAGVSCFLVYLVDLDKQINPSRQLRSAIARDSPAVQAIQDLYSMAFPQSASPDEVTHLLSRALLFLSMRCPLNHSVV